MQYNLLKMIFNAGIRYDKIVNITATDFPVVAMSKIIKELSNDTKDWIIGYNLGSDKTGRQQSKLTCFHCQEHGKYAMHLFKLMKLKRFKSYKSLNRDFYFGSEYWAISYDILKELLEAWEKDTELQKILRFAFAPSEIWIHTLYFNSQYADRGCIKNDDSHLINLSPLTYFEYGDKIKVLTEDDFQAVCDSGKLFSRKIIVGKSDKLVMMLKKRKEYGDC